MPVFAGAAIKAAMNSLSDGGKARKHVRPGSAARKAEGREEEMQREKSMQKGNPKTYPAINLKRSIHDLERWPEMVKGYISIASYTLFFGIFTYLVIWQLAVPDAFDIDNLARNSFLDQDGALTNIEQHGDFFDYLLNEYDEDSGEFVEGTGPYGGILGTMFTSKYYNDQPIPASDAGFLFSYNKLIGGVLLTQTRGKREPCGVNSGDSAYSMFYPECYTEKIVTADPPKEIMIDVQHKCGEKKRASVFNTTHPKYQDYLESIKASSFGIALETSKELANVVYRDTIYDSFQYKYENEGNKGFSAFLSLSDGTMLNLQKIQYLKEAKWLDKDTRGVEIRFIFYNGNLGTFSFVQISFTFGTSGRYGVYDPEATSVQQMLPGGNHISIGTINMEPYITTDDFSRLGLEVVFLIWVFYDMFSLSIALFKIATDRDGYQKGDEVFNAWYVLDIVNYACYIQFIYYRLQVLQMSVCNPVFVPANNYLTIFEEIYVIQQQQLTVNFISVLLGIFRFFKYYQFQPRLQIVNLTLASSAIHLFHFSVVFLVMLFGFALIGHLNFGGQVRDFATWFNSLQVMWESLFGAYDLGPVIGNQSISYVDPMIANLFFYLWQFLTGMILMNIFVAILMDGYAEAVEAGKEAANRAGLPGPDAVYDDVTKAIKKVFKKGDKRAWRYTDNTLLTVLLALDKENSDPVHKHHTYIKRYEKELSQLKDERDRMDERIEFLESMTGEELEEKPFHPLWQDKHVTYDKIVEHLQMQPSLKGAVNLQDVQDIYDSSLRYVEKLPHQDEGTPLHVSVADDDSRMQLHAHLEERVKKLMLDNTLLIKQHGQLLKKQAEVLQETQERAAEAQTRNPIVTYADLVVPVDSNATQDIGWQASTQVAHDGFANGRASPRRDTDDIVAA
mmetsp:Transcript_15138/g.22102  ORF Transcript_15138/g.22102 Transcript_15138/m.22102 type:complete len:902 (+) Transcript_15138:188-2893(+)